MPVTLTITSYHNRAATEQVSKVIDRGSITVGRSPENDWVLTDPEMVLSRKHCIIERRDDGYYITDTSVNGVFINQSGQRLGKGNSAKLSDGDQLSLGDYLIQVSVSDDLVVDDLHGSLDIGSDTLADKPDIFADVPESRGASFDDPFRELGESAGPISEAAPGELKRNERLDPLGLEEHDSLGWHHASESDHVPAEQEFIQVPKPSRPSAPPPGKTPSDSEAAAADKAPAQELIPDQFFEEDSLIKQIKRSDLEEILPKPLPPEPDAKPDKSLDSILEPEDFSDLGKAPAPAPEVLEPPVAPEKITEEIPRVELPPRKPAAAAKAAAAKQAADNASVPARARAPAATTTESGALDSAAFKAFLHGAGIEKLNVGADEVPELMRVLGVILRQISTGIIDVLRARGKIKNEFHIDRTLVGPVDNNPLKVLPNAEEAMYALLGHRGSTWMSPVDAIQESFDDIKTHELAVIAGMQAALKQLLKSFDPEQFEEQFADMSKLELLAGNRKAKCWDAFRRHYQKISEVAEDDLQELFQREFSRAYEAQLRGAKTR